MRQSRTPRVVRGVCAATFATFAALLAHLAGGGAMPGWLGIVAPWLLSIMVCTLVSGSRMSPVRIVVGVIASQLLFHALFVIGTVTPTAPSGGHHHNVAIVLDTPASALLVAESSMWAGHLLAAAVTIYVLVHGEIVVTVLRTLAARLVTWLCAKLTAFTRGGAPARHAEVRILSYLPAWSDLVLLSSVRRRGPPALHLV